MAGYQTTQAVSAADLSVYDAIIDVRSPSEFALDHVPGAENLPVLDDAQRAEVGTIYVQESRFLARRIGAAHVARNIARHLETALADRPSSFRPLIYCWRGGQRSDAMATILAQVGWPVTLLQGGYRTYRRYVTARLYDEEQPLKLMLLDGHTGSAKTEILNTLPELGVQVLDLEGLAEHRGSLFGALAGRPQPSQKMFESRLLGALHGLDLARPIVVEAEASKIGDRMTPPMLWRAMQAAPRIVLEASQEHRAAYLARTYGDIAADPQALEAAFARLPIPPSRERLETWRGLIAAGEFAALAQALIGLHYDPAYDRAARKADAPVAARLPLNPLDPDSRAQAARRIKDLTVGAFGRV
ncbi:tRNA 2-selenouridine(34) synthase MnmH [Phenylobacterium sp.]|uniref:tRNA 2-selenouridine(34) synthase MnmH n=1 Tax=Phenylobacterium sp. TaxID=1871053 RepID=UPI002730E1F2|nr:tRNA 2-selenouridine(34) synthase MnmH [Phenylobacterium sp.]MDP1615833.1 tRNA 2-selenouridine(34) synthase MnmH [Phenylobacterium sp.]MDP1986884.1 tRNA 2-selenouridine(34) synthase MnmH [Phenylobacterium sp.]